MKNKLVYLLGLLLITAGINHFWHPGVYLEIMPLWVPFPIVINIIIGCIEIILGILLMNLSTRNIAAWSIIILLIIIFPANIQMVLNLQESNAPLLTKSPLVDSRFLLLSILRLPLQLLFIYWAFTYTKLYNDLNIE